MMTWKTFAMVFERHLKFLKCCFPLFSVIDTLFEYLQLSCNISFLELLATVATNCSCHYFSFIYMNQNIRFFHLLTVGCF